jgi:hypothetical protein
MAIWCLAGCGPTIFGMIECYRERTEVLKDDIAAKVDISLMDPDVVEQ